MRGGHWGDGVAAGEFALSLCDSRSRGNTGVGFRAALSLCQMLKSYGILSSTQGIKGFVSLPQGKKIKMP